MMEQTKHTPGPWFFDVHPDNTQAVLVDADGCTIIYLSKPFPNTLNKDVQLIAAAPDLADALASLLEDQRDASLHVLAQARAAIAKARGE